MVNSPLLTPDELVERWKGSVKVRTLEQWRYKGIGPKYTKIGQKVMYHLTDIEEYERSQVK